MEITLSDLKELLVAQTAPAHYPLAPDGTKVILVLQRGWVAVGTIHTSASTVTLTGAAIVRRWGTTAGLGQLAAEGPQRETKLDPVPYGITCHILSIVACFPCVAAAWSGQ